MNSLRLITSFTESSTADFQRFSLPKCSATHTTPSLTCIARINQSGFFADLLPSISQFVEGISGDDVAADELHGWIAL